MSDLDNTDGNIGNTRSDEIENDLENKNRNKEAREDCLHGNETTTYNKAVRHNRPFTSELLERKFETMASETNVRISKELDGLLFSMNRELWTMQLLVQLFHKFIQQLGLQMATGRVRSRI